MRRALPAMLIAGVAMCGCATQPEGPRNLALDSRFCMNQASAAGTGATQNVQTPANLWPYGSLSQQDAYQSCMISRGHIPGVNWQTPRNQR